jgi:hypothetical protein
MQNCKYEKSSNINWTFFLLFVSSDHDVVPLAIAQHIIVRFLTNENMISAEILMRLRAWISNETLSRAWVHDCSKSFKEGLTEVQNMPHVRQLRISMNQVNAKKKNQWPCSGQPLHHGL